MALDIEKRILYRDASMLVVNKPAGLPVHKGKGGGETLDDHLEALRFGLPRLPALAHRLDKDTSGCLVLGRHRRSIAELGQLFKNSKINKIYWAVVSETISDIEGIIDLPIGPKNPDDKRNWQMKATPDGLPSLTHYKVLGQGGGLSLLELRPVTGRTHQLRVHCAAMGWPIMGDRIYGVPHESGLQLHARAITVPLYPKKDPITVVAPPPEHMMEALVLCGMCE